MSTNQPTGEPSRREELFKNNPFRDNPYQSPGPETSAGAPGGPLPQPWRRGMVAHIPVVSILMIIQGALEAFMGLIQVFYAVFMPIIIRTDIQRMEDQMQGGPGQTPPPEIMMWIMGGMFGAFATVCLVAALLHIWAGIRMLGYRGRTLGFVALIAGMASSITCYCAPTAIALGVYGLVTLLNPEVQHVFAMRQQGYSKREIEDAFG